ncbi:hypothetical protein NMG60_11036694 [Bertholletia excelsa]
MKELIGAIVKLLVEAELFLVSSGDVPEVVIKKRPPDITKYDALKNPFMETLDLLKNEEVKSIGIHGIKGSGKTTIMETLNDHEEVAALFDIVIWLKVSLEDSVENKSIDQLQKDISHRLVLNVEGTNDNLLANVSEFLKDKKCLLLLDEVKEIILDYRSTLGISNSNKHKMVLTTTRRDVCASMVDRQVNVKRLSEEQAWEMFKHFLERPEFIKDLDGGSLARRLCKQCCGIPLWLRVVAKALKVQDEYALWKPGILDCWRIWPERQSHKIEKLYKLLRMFYDKLKENDKKCFLYGALYPEDHEIFTDYLTECWAAEDFLGDGMIEELSYGRPTLKHLLNLSLFEEGKDKKYVKMHKFIRKMALSILSEEFVPRCLVRTSEAQQRPIPVDSWNQKGWISLSENEFLELPDCPDCSMLSTLFLQNNLCLKNIPVLFFEKMKQCLRVLDLSHTGIASLPQPLSDVVGLRVLYLRDCKYLPELPSDMVNLQQLVVLDIRRSGVSIVPSFIRKLNSLRRLRVSFTKCEDQNQNQEGNMLPELSKLVELVIDVRSSEEQSIELVKNVMKKVAAWKELMILRFIFNDQVVDAIDKVSIIPRFRFPDVDTLLTFFDESHPWRNIRETESFQFFIGCEGSKQPQIPELHEYTRYVKYCNRKNNDLPLTKIFASVDAFELINNEGIKELLELKIPWENQVQGCLIESCSALECIDASNILPNIQYLYLKDLPGLQSIWKSPAQAASLTKLKTLVMSGCQNLEKIFPPDVIPALCKIEYLEIEECPKIVQVIEEFEGVQNQDLLQNLNKLVLRKMEGLERICVNTSFNWPALNKLEIYECQSLLRLPFNSDNARGLKFIKCEQDWWEKVQFPCLEFKLNMQPQVVQ